MRFQHWVSLKIAKYENVERGYDSDRTISLFDTHNQVQREILSIPKLKSVASSLSVTEVAQQLLAIEQPGSAQGKKALISS